MRKFLLSIVAGAFCISAFAQQTQTIQLSSAENKLELKSVTQGHFRAKAKIKELNFENKSDVNGEFSIMDVEGMIRSNNIGKASLPVISKLIEVPYGAEIQVVINSYTEEVINLSDYGISRIEPNQPSYNKSTPVEEQYFVIDNDYYNTDELESNPLISTEISGIMRGVRIGYVQIRPYHYNPVENTLTVYNNLDFEITFINADFALTEDMKNRYFAPEYEAVYQTMLNYIAPAAKDIFSNYAAPLKYVIVANTAFQATLQPFVQWKTKQGYNVIEKYVASGTTNTSIKAYLQGLYNAGTALDPAPLYLLIIGDHSGTYSIPSFASQNTGSGGTDQISDLYFATLSGSDYLPDMYYGRISAESTTELSNALNKILPYEKYTIADGSYLNNCVLIAGVDASNAHIFGDAQILYGTNNYYNTAHGWTNVWAYFYNNASNPYNVMASSNTGAEASVISKLQTGVGFANYTAHCSDDGWADPTISRADIANFNNAGKLPFMIGNCCQSFMFNSSDAFGEILLYTAGEGAVGYIGTSQFSYWYEDSWWGMGNTTLTLNATNWASHTYANTGIGVYDGIWHDHGEAYSNWYYSGSQIVQRGNLAVQASTSSMKQYYWEIYHLSGDPSLMPYSTEPDALSLSFSNPMQGATSLTVTTEPYTYVAVSKNNVLLDAEWSGSGTNVSLTVPAFTGETYCVVGTKQDRSPYINESVIPTSPFPPVAAFSGTPTIILEGQSVTFTDASQYPASWAWNFGDTQTSTLQNPVHIYTTAGTYTVSLTTTNLIGSDIETKTNYITVNPNLNPPTAQFTADVTSVTIGGNVNFTDLSINNPASWSWSFDGGTPATSTDQNPSVVYNTAGTYQVVLTATNAHGSDVETKLAYIIVNLPDYCTAGSTSSAYEFISKVVCNTISNSSAATTYTDFTSVSTNLTIGSAYTITVTNGSTSYNTDQCLAWVDWNRDGDFVDAGENILSSANGVGPYSTSFTVPAVATAGNVRVRVRIHDTGNTPNATPCGNSGFGEVEDYTFNLISSAVPPTANFTSDVTSTCTGIVQFTDQSIGATSWAWNFGDGSSTEQNPQHTFTSNGTYTVSLTATNAYGSDTHSVTNMITVDMPIAPTTTGASACGAATLNLAATGNGTLAWYDAATNGNQVTTGGSYSSLFNNTTTLYVQSEIENLETGNVGALNNSIGAGGNFTNTQVHGLIFDATQDITIVSVYMYSGATANKTITLKNSSDVTIATATVNVPTGGARVTLNFDVPAGTGYKLLGPGSPNLYRNTAGGSYPYQIDGVVSITTNTATNPAYYYYFYNWEVEYNVPCVSARTPVTATINNLPTVNLGADVTQCGGPVTLDAGAGHSSYVWNGTTGTQTYSATTTGTYSVVVSNAQSCTASDAVSVTINPIPNAVMISGGGTQCGGSMTLTATGGTGGTIYWQGTISGGTSITTPSSIQTVSSNGTYYFRAKSAQGCWGPEGSATVTINTIPTDVIVTGGGTQCGGSMTLTATGGTGGTIYWQNTTSNGTSTATASSSQTVSTSGTYHFRAQSAEGCWGNQGSAVVTIYPAVDIALSSTDESVPGANDGTATVTVNSGTPTYSYTWNVAGTNSTLTGLSGGTYCVTVVDVNGCFDSGCVTVNTLDAPPVANFAADYTMGCDNLTVTFSDLSSNTPTSWAWDFGDLTSSNLQNPTHTYSAVGNYTVSLTVTNGDGNDTKTIVNMITVGEIPTIILSMTQETVLGNDGTVSVVASGGLYPYSYNWNVAGTGSTLTGLVAGNYCVTVIEANGCQAVDCIAVTQEAALTPPVADFEADNTVGCDNLTVTFSDLSSNSPTSWTWDFGDSNTSDLQNPTHTYSSVGNYTVSLTVTNADGNDTKTIVNMITVGEIPTIILSMTPETVLGNDGTISVVVTGGLPPYSYNWDVVGTGSTLTGLVAGNYCVTVVDVNGCQANDCITVTQVAALVPPVANFEADVTVGCESLTVQFTDLSTNSPTVWSWNFGDGSSTSSDANPQHTYTTPGSYNVSLYVENGDGNDELVESAFIYIGQSPDIFVDVIHASGEFVADGSALVSIIGGTAPYSIEWSTTETGNSISGLTPGNYSVMVVDAIGCIETLPFIISWTNGIANSTEIAYSIFPNPAKDIVTVKMVGAVADQIQVTNVLGQSVISITPDSEITNIDLSALESGIYFIKVYVGREEFINKLVINQ